MASSSPVFQNNSPAHRFIRFVLFALVQLFYPHIEVKGRENLPKDVPLIFVLNHPNGLIDPLVLMIGLNRLVSFLSKSTLFGSPVGKLVNEAFGALPIYRKQDEGKRGGPHGDARERNAKTFARCYALLTRGRAMALFPEGTTHSAPQLLPLRSGAARIALGAEETHDWSFGVQIVPVGLWYQSKTHFRTSVLLVVGEPFGLGDYAETCARARSDVVREVTRQIEQGLDQVVLQAENADLLSAIPLVANWVASNGQPVSMAEQHEISTNLLSGYKQLQQSNPVRLEAIAAQARHYADTLQTLGIDDPWTLERPAVKGKRLAWLVLMLVITLPLALAGLLMSYIPYRITGLLATYFTRSYDTQTSTVKLLGGAVLVLLAWITEAIVVGLMFGWGWGLLLGVTAPPLAYIALRWGEGWRALGTLLSARWLRWRRGQLVQSLIEQRQTIARQIIEASREI